MYTFRSFITEDFRKVTIKMPFKKGWWLDKNEIMFYHGTHKNNLKFIEQHGIVAPTEGSTAHWVSLALDPYTAHAYAAMSGEGGETKFRQAGGRPVNVPHSDRVVLVVKLSKNDVIEKMAPARGAMEETRNRLRSKEEYERLVVKGKMSDEEYYMKTEIRYPNVVSPEHIVGYTYLRPGR